MKEVLWFEVPQFTALQPRTSNLEPGTSIHE